MPALRVRRPPVKREVLALDPAQFAKPAAKGVPARASPVVEGQDADPRCSPRLTRGRRKPACVEYGESSRDEAQPGGTPNECAAALKFARVKRSARRSVGSREEIHLSRLRHAAWNTAKI